MRTHSRSFQEYLLVFAVPVILIISACGVTFRWGGGQNPVDISKYWIVYRQYDIEDPARGGIVFLDARKQTTPYPSNSLMDYPIVHDDKKEILFNDIYGFRSFNYIGKMSLWTAGEQCADHRFYGRLRWDSGDNALLAITTQLDWEKRINESKIVSLDIPTCTIERTYYSETGSVSFQDPHNSGGRIVFTQWKVDGYRIMLVDLQTSREREIGRGLGAAWSPDGTMIAYTGGEGIHLWDAQSGEDRRIVELSDPVPDSEDLKYYDIWPPMANWAGDSNTLIFHVEEQDTYCIYTYELETDAKTQILCGGLNPDFID